jgi:dihydroorotase-like cyclic amidohydrolase
MWQGLRDGSLDFVVTDHCPFTLAQKRGERRTAEFRRSPAGSTVSPPVGAHPCGRPGELAQDGLAQDGLAQGQPLPLIRTPSPPEAPWSDGLPPFNQIPGGAPGVETRLPLVYHFGVNQGRLSLNQFVAVTSTAAARRFGLYPQKGAIVPGADADLVLFDPGREVTISAGALHQNCDYTPYEGFRVKGWPRSVLSRGEVIVRDGEFIGAKGRGKFLKR